VMMGHTEPGLAAARRAVSVDPLNFSAHGWLASALILARHYKEANVAIERAMQLAPNTDIPLAAFRGEVYYILGDYESARASCEIKPTDPESQYCLALVYAKLGRRPDAQRALQKRRATQGDADAYLYATHYAQWGDVPQALDWLDKAMGLRDSGLERVKTDALLDPIRNQARFQAIERELKFPE
jgi:tetratricopeptide (TPR) repeat protein